VNDQSPETLTLKTEESALVVEMLDLTIDKFVFAEVINDDFTYTPKANKVYKAGDTMYIYIEPKNYASFSAGAGYSMDLIEGLYVEDPNGELIIAAGDAAVVTENPSDAVAIRNAVTFPDTLTEGTYKITIMVTDFIADTDAEQTEEFTIVK